MGEIKPGDLVMVVKPRPCCGGLTNLGLTFTVGKIVRDSLRCRCGVITHSDPIATTGVINSRGRPEAVLVCCLKKIDPPAIGDTLPIREELHA